METLSSLMAFLVGGNDGPTAFDDVTVKIKVRGQAFSTSAGTLLRICEDAQAHRREGRHTPAFAAVLEALREEARAAGAAEAANLRGQALDQRLVDVRLMKAPIVNGGASVDEV